MRDSKIRKRKNYIKWTLHPPHRISPIPKITYFHLLEITTKNLWNKMIPLEILIKVPKIILKMLVMGNNNNIFKHNKLMKTWVFIAITTIIWKVCTRKSIRRKKSKNYTLKSIWMKCWQLKISVISICLKIEKVFFSSMGKKSIVFFFLQ